jgi:NADH-quinone oxidoreductase subunit L
VFFSPNPLNIESGWFYKWVKTPTTIVPKELAFPFMINENISQEVVHSEVYMEAMHHAHSTAMMISLLMAGLGILLAFVIYQWRFISADNLAIKLRPLYNFSYNKWYFDELYSKTAVAFTLGLSNFLAWFDQKVIDGIVNGTATITRHTSFASGTFDKVVVDGLVNLTAAVTGFFGLVFRKLQTGKVQTYLVMVLTGIIILFFIFKSI